MAKDSPQAIENREYFSKKLNLLMNLNDKKQIDLSKDLNIPKSTLTGYVKGTSLPSPGTVQKIADYFNVKKSDLDLRFIEPDSNSTTTDGMSRADRRDIAKSLDEMMAQIESKSDEPLMYNGVELSDSTLSLLKNAFEFALIETKKINKVKYNPNKNKK